MSHALRAADDVDLESVASPDLVHYMDESGHDVIFDGRGRSIVGRPGCSKTFIVGAAEIPNEREFALQLSELRLQLLSDPSTKILPSLDPARGRTAIFFHAKDDHPKVRERVFELIKTFDVRVFAAFRRKAAIAFCAKHRAHCGGGYEVRPGKLYRNLILRLMTKRFRWLPGHHHVIVAKRKKANKWIALRDALVRADERDRKAGFASGSRRLTIQPAFPSDHAGLQIVDYYLWALQRLLERSEDRYFDLLRSGFTRVYDLDDRRTHEAGERYFEGNPLTLEKLKPVISG